MLFVADMSQRVCYGTIRSYLSAIRARLARPTDREDTIRPSTEGLQTWSAKNTGRTPADYTPDFGDNQSFSERVYRQVRTATGMGCMLPRFFSPS